MLELVILVGKVVNGGRVLIWRDLERGDVEGVEEGLVELKVVKGMEEDLGGW